MTNEELTASVIAELKNRLTIGIKIETTYEYPWKNLVLELKLDDEIISKSDCYIKIEN